MNIIYCSIEPYNPVDRVEIDRLSKVANVIVVTTFSGSLKDFGKKTILLKKKRFWSLILKSWVKIATIFCRLPNSNIAIRFPERNLYQNSKFVTSVSNLLWTLRQNNWLNKFLPRYSSIVYALPWGLIEKKVDAELTRADVIIFNSLQIVSKDFIPLIKKLKKFGVLTVANVRSWDNPYYVQFDTRAERYLVWSPFMAETVAKAQQLNITPDNYIFWGPNLINKFFQTCRNQKTLSAKDSCCSRSGNEIMIGYAAAFGEINLAITEYRFICQLIVALERSGVKAKILYRPYPTIQSELLKAQQSADSVLIYDINSDTVDRYADGRELIRFGSPEERHRFLSKCDIFLSLGTTFTLEAFVYGLDVFHMYIPPHGRVGYDEEQLFKRIEITCDHFFDYLTGDIDFICSKEDLASKINDWQTESQRFSSKLSRIGLKYLESEVRIKNDIKQVDHQI